MRGSDDDRRSHSGHGARRHRQGRAAVRRPLREGPPDPGCRAHSRGDDVRARAESAALARCLPPSSMATVTVRRSAAGPGPSSRTSRPAAPRPNYCPSSTPPRTGELWSDVAAVASAWSQAADAPVRAGDFVATIGFASGDYLTVDLVCGYLGLVAVPLQHNAPVSRLQPILAETEPAVLAVSAAYLDLAVESVLGSRVAAATGRVRLRADVDDDRERLEPGPRTNSPRRA